MGRTTARRIWLKRIVMLLAVALILWLSISYFVVWRLTHRREPVCDEPIPTLTWAKVEPLRLTTEDKEELGAWFLEGQAQQPSVVLLHGNGQCRSFCLKQAQLAYAAGCSVLLVTVRAHGDSTGDFNDLGFSARYDVLAAVEWLEKRKPDASIVLWGQSLGAAAAVFAAQSLGTRVQGYILECPYQDLRTAVRNRTRFYLPSPFSWIAYAGIRTVGPLVIPNLERISPLEAVGTIPSSTPVLILAGSRDHRATPIEAEMIHARVQSHSRLVIIEGGDHLHLPDADEAGYWNAVTGFLAQVTHP